MLDTNLKADLSGLEQMVPHAGKVEGSTLRRGEIKVTVAAFRKVREPFNRYSDFFECFTVVSPKNCDELASAATGRTALCRRTKDLCY
jgi:hypothetical protein